MQVNFKIFAGPRTLIMIFNLTARLIILPKIDLQARLQRYNQYTPANVLERYIFDIFDVAICLKWGLSFLFNDNIRNRICEHVYYLYEHPDHDDSVSRLTRRFPYTTKWVIYSFPKVKHIWRSYVRFSQNLKSLVPTYKSSPSFFGISPKLAVVIHGAGKRAEELKIPNGCVIAFLSFTCFLSRSLLLIIWYSSQHTGP